MFSKKKSKSRGKKLSLLPERMAGQEKVLGWRCSQASDDWNETRVCTWLHCAIERRKFGSAAMPSHTSTRWSPGQRSFQPGALKSDRKAVLWRRKSQTPVDRRSHGRHWWCVPHTPTVWHVGEAGKGQRMTYPGKTRRRRGKHGRRKTQPPVLSRSQSHGHPLELPAKW